MPIGIRPSLACHALPRELRFSCTGLPTHQHPDRDYSGPMDPEYVFNKALPYLTSKLEDAGLTVQLGFNKTERTMFLLLNDSVKCGINQLINELLDAEPDAHHDLMDPWVPYLIERTRIDETILNKPDELRRLIRTEFCTADAVAHPQFSYARQYPGGLALTLSLDCPTPLFRLKDEQLAQCPLSIDELFHCAQKNTDDLPIERIQQFGPFTCLSAQSPFVTAKAANIPALMSRFPIQAPHGLFFTIPANHMMYYAPADPANISKQLWDLADLRPRPRPHHDQAAPGGCCEPRHLLLLAGRNVRADHAGR